MSEDTKPEFSDEEDAILDRIIEQKAARHEQLVARTQHCLLYTSDAADE